VPVAGELALETRGEFFWSAQDVPEEEIGSGLTELAIGSRLRAPVAGALELHAGLVHARLMGQTRDIARADGEDPNDTRAVVGMGLAF